MEAGEVNGERRSATPLWVAIGVLLVVALGLYVWKVAAVNDAEDRMAEARERWGEETREAVAERTRSLLDLSAESLGLAIREAAMARDLGRIESYLDRLVQEPGVERGVYAVADSVRVATDRSLLGASLESIAPGASSATETSVERGEGGAWRVVVPITGVNQRLGVVVLDYRAEEPAGPADGPGAEGT